MNNRMTPEEAADFAAKGCGHLILKVLGWIITIIAILWFLGFIGEIFSAILEEFGLIL